MKMCQSHWEMLRQEVIDQGLGEWIASSGEVALEQTADQLAKGGEQTRANYDPLMASFWMISSRSMSIAGLAVMYEDFGCPICRFNEARTPEGGCNCPDPDCPAKPPGSVPDHETWLRGPDSCVTAAKNYMREQGWIQ